MDTSVFFIVTSEHENIYYFVPHTESTLVKNIRDIVSMKNDMRWFSDKKQWRKSTDLDQIEFFDSIRVDLRPFQAFKTDTFRDISIQNIKIDEFYQLFLI